MAQKVQTLFVDDLDGSEADGTIRFGLDGTEYEIDLNAKHAQELRDALRFASAAAALKCTRFGGAFAAPQRAEVEELLNQDRAPRSAQTNG